MLTMMMMLLRVIWGSPHHGGRGSPPVTASSALPDCGLPGLGGGEDGNDDNL